MKNNKSSLNNVALSQSPFSIAKSQILISQAQSQLQTQRSKSQSELDDISERHQQRLKMLKCQILISSIFIAFIVLEIIVISKKSFYNPEDIPQCQKQMLWTIASITTKFFFALNIIISWKQMKQMKIQKRYTEESNKRSKIGKIILLMCIASIVGQFVYIKYECGVLQISLIVLGTLLSFICLMAILIFILRKIL